MHVLFVYDSIAKSFHSGISALSAYLKLHGHSAALLTVRRHHSLEEFRSSFIGLSRKAGIVAVTAMTTQWPRLLQLFPVIREEFKGPIVCGGYHPTIRPEEVISHPCIDMICIGDGEEALLELAEALERGGDVFSIKNLWIKAGREGFFRGKEAVFRNDIRVLNPDLDSLPYWDREIYAYEDFYNEFAEVTFFYAKRTIPIAAGRGCPYACTFCSNAFMSRLYRKCRSKYLRRRSVDSLLGEMNFLAANYPVEGFEFWDEQFEVNIQWLEEFRDKYPRELGFPFLVGLRPENATPEVLSILKDAGCRVACIGIESGNEEYRQNVLNKKCTNRQILAAFANAREAGISPVALVMVGMPEEDRRLAQETLELVRRIRPDHIMISAFRPLPGTKLYEYCVEKGYVIDENMKQIFNTPKLALNQPSMSEEEFQEIWQEWAELEKEPRPK